MGACWHCAGVALNFALPTEPGLSWLLLAPHALLGASFQLVTSYEALRRRRQSMPSSTANLLGIPLTSFVIMPASFLGYLLMPLGLEAWVR